MIAIKYQVLLFDPRVSRERQLIAIKPAFDTPAAHETLLKTAKFETKRAVILVGHLAQINELLKELERVDLTDWLDFNIEERVTALKTLCQDHDVTCEDQLRPDGDPHYIVSDEVTAATRDYPYPNDLPKANCEIWDAVTHYPPFKDAKVRLIGFNKLHSTTKYAIYSNFYEELCRIREAGPVSAYHNTTQTDVIERTDRLAMQLERCHLDAIKLLKYAETHVLDRGLIKKAGAEKFQEIVKDPKSNLFVIRFVVPWTLDPSVHHWRTLKGYLLREIGRKYAMTDVGGKLKHKMPTAACEVVFQPEAGKVMVEIDFKLTSQDAESLTGQKDPVKTFKKLNELARRWLTTKRLSVSPI